MLTGQIRSIGAKIQKPLANFHSPNHRALDFKLRFSFKKTPLWGGYMTDIIKDFEQVITPDGTSRVLDSGQPTIH